MNHKPSIQNGDRVRVVAAAQKLPFWKYDGWRKADGVVLSDYPQGKKVVRLSLNGIPRTYYLDPNDLEKIDAEVTK